MKTQQSYRATSACSTRQAGRKRTIPVGSRMCCSLVSVIILNSIPLWDGSSRNITEHLLCVRDRVGETKINKASGLSSEICRQASTNTFTAWDCEGFSRPLMYLSDSYLWGHYHVPGHRGAKNAYSPSYSGAYEMASHTKKYVMANW